MNDDANHFGRDDRNGEPAKTAQLPKMEARRLAVSNRSRAALLFAALLVSAGGALFLARPPRLAGPDSRIRALLDEVDRMALVVPGAEQPGLEPYFLDRFEVTNEQYALFLRAADQSIEAWPAGESVPTALAADDPRGKHPVVFVSHSEAVAFAAALHKRLPSVLEWQYAAGLGASSDWDSVSRYRMNLLETGLGSTARVGTFEGGRTRADDRIAPAVYDLIGNVAEWCAAEPAAPGVTPIAPVLGGSFNDSILDARARFAQDSSTVEDRNWALGFRCLREDAEEWLRQLVTEISALSGPLRREHVERLRRFGDPLGRIIEKSRLRGATEREILADESLDVSDRYLSLDDGSFLWIHDSHIERIDLEVGRVARTPDLGTIRGVARTIGSVTGSWFMITTEAPERSAGVSLWLTVDAMGRFEVRDGNLARIREASDSGPRYLGEPLPTLPVATRFLPQCVLTERFAWLPIAIGELGSGVRIVEVDAGDSRLTVTRKASLAAVDEVMIDADRNLIYTRNSVWFELPYYAVPYALEFGDGVTVISAVALESGAMLSQLVLMSPSLGMQISESPLDRVLIVGDHGFDLVDGFATAQPVVRTAFANRDDTFRITDATPLFGHDALIEARDDQHEKTLLARIDSSGELLALRALDTSNLRATHIAVLAADTIMLIGANDTLICLDGQLRQRWTARGAPYTFEFCPPVEIDLDGDGVHEYAVPFGREGVFGIVCYDASSGRETERLLTEGHHVLTLLSARDSGAAKGLIAGVRELGLLKLRAPTGETEEALRRLEAALAARPGTDRSP